MDRRTIATLALLAAGAAAPAAAAPPLPQEPADGAVSPAARPAFAWTPGTSGVPVARYEVYLEGPGGPVRVAQAPPGATSARATVDLPDDATHRWFVRLVNANGGTASTPPEARRALTVATPAAPPALAALAPPAPGVHAFAWTGDRVASRWALLDDAGAAVREGAFPTPSGRLALEGLPDGAYVLRVAQSNVAGDEGAPATRAFVVDGTAPAALVPVPAGPAAFAWTGMEPGAIATWRVLDAAGRAVAGPADTAAARADAGPLPPGAYVLEVRQTDAAGNPGPWARLAVRVGPATRSRPSSWRRHAHRLRPRAGAVVRTRRPVLRWTAGPRGATAYNLQVFELAGTRLRKVRSAYPTGTRHVLPRRAALRAGRCYVWRVWPYRGRRYTAAPLAVSDFCVRAPRRAGR